MRARLVTLTVLLGLVTAAPSSAGVANRGVAGASPANPISGLRHGSFIAPTRVPSVDPPSAYFNTTADPFARSVFGDIASVPRFRWFGANVPVRDSGFRATYKPGAYQTARHYIATVRQGDPNRLVSIAIFRLQPFEKAICRQIPTAAQQRDYREWVDQFAAGIRDSSARVALLLQPDMPFVRCLPHRSRVAIDLVRYAARVFNALPFTTVYLDAGASDWLRVGQASAMLRDVGIRGVRGFGLNLTHYASTRESVAYGKAILRDLARHGVRGKHFVVSTAMNGRPFRSYRHRRTFLDGTLCRTRASRSCVTLGQRPTTSTGDPAVDAFLWLGRPEYNNRTIRTAGELLQMHRTSPYFGR